MSEDEHNELRRTTEALRSQITNDARDVGLLYERIVALLQEVDELQARFRHTVEDLSSLIERLKNEDDSDDDWWREGGEPPGYEE